MSLISILFFTSFLYYSTTNTAYIPVSSTSTYLLQLLNEIEQWGPLPAQHQLKLHLRDNYVLIALLYHLYQKLHRPIFLSKNPDLKQEKELITDGENLRKELKDSLLEQREEQPDEMPIPSLPHYPSTCASLWKNKFQLHSDIDNLIHFYAHREDLQKYIIERAQWQPETFNKIIWPAFAVFL